MKNRGLMKQSIGGYEAMKPQRYCILCGDPISQLSARGLCKPCAMHLRGRLSVLRRIENGNVVPWRENFGKPNLDFYGVHPTCRECCHKCKQYAAPNSVIVGCRAIWEAEAATGPEGDRP